jgi:hypothetical protein
MMLNYPDCSSLHMESTRHTAILHLYCLGISVFRCKSWAGVLLTATITMAIDCRFVLVSTGASVAQRTES